MRLENSKIQVRVRDVLSAKLSIPVTTWWRRAGSKMLHSLCLPQRQMRWTAWDDALSPERDKEINQRQSLANHLFSFFFFYWLMWIYIATNGQGDTRGQNPMKVKGLTKWSSWQLTKHCSWFDEFYIYLNVLFSSANYSWNLGHWLNEYYFTYILMGNGRNTKVSVV